MTDVPAPRWRKSTRSGGSGQCVEVADNLPGAVRVRDSKNPDGAVLFFHHAHWRAFLRAIKYDTLAR